MTVKNITQPIKPKDMIRVLVLIIVALSFLAGYYHSAWQVEQQKYQQLENQSNKTLLEIN